MSGVSKNGYIRHKDSASGGLELPRVFEPTLNKAAERREALDRSERRLACVTHTLRIWRVTRKREVHPRLNGHLEQKISGPTPAFTERVHIRHSNSAVCIFISMFFIVTSCGTLGNPGKEPTGWENLPMAGVAPYIEIDIDNDPTNSTQPFITLPVEPSGPAIRPVVGNEPCVIEIGSEYYMWYELDGNIYSIESADGQQWQGLESGGEPTPITWLDQPGAWENGKVAAPSVLFDPSDMEAPYKMWYSGGDRTGIGLALSTDGLHWRHSGPQGDLSPVLVPCLAWEGGPTGSIGSPTVILDDGLYRMWYDGLEYGTDPDGVQRIGYAYSEDGRSWSKTDAKGNVTGGDTCTLKQETVPVDPVLSPTPITPCNEDELKADPLCQEWSLRRNWEWKQVWAPYVMRDDSSQRKIYRMYYTGGYPEFWDPNNVGSNISRILLMSLCKIATYSTSVGYAGSVDGIQWIKQQSDINPVNPVLAEPFQLDLGGFMEYWCKNPSETEKEKDLACWLKDLLTEVSLRMVTNIYTPTVVKDPTEFKMWFRQNDLLNIVMPPGHYEGIGLATNPPRNLFGTGPGS